MPKTETECAKAADLDEWSYLGQMIPPGAQDAGDGATGFGSFSAGC